MLRGLPQDGGMTGLRRKRPSALARCAVLAALPCVQACLTGPAARPGSEVNLTSQELSLTDQRMTGFGVRLAGQLSSPYSMKLERASYVLVLDGKEIKAGEKVFQTAVGAGQPLAFQIDETGGYGTRSDGQAPAEGREVLVALRGTLLVRRGDRQERIAFARSKQLLRPRPPRVELRQLDGARYSDEEVNLVFFLAVVNPNPFPVRLAAFDYAISIGDKQLGEGRLAQGDQLGAGASGVFEIQLALNRETYGPQVARLIRTQTLQYRVAGEVRGDEFRNPCDLRGEVKLHASK